VLMALISSVPMGIVSDLNTKQLRCEGSKEVVKEEGSFRRGWEQTYTYIRYNI
jgi:hypothetical protein